MCCAGPLRRSVCYYWFCGGICSKWRPVQFWVLRHAVLAAGNILYRRIDWLVLENRGNKGKVAFVPYYFLSWTCRYSWDFSVTWTERKRWTGKGQNVRPDISLYKPVAIDIVTCCTCNRYQPRCNDRTSISSCWMPGDTTVCSCCWIQVPATV